MIHNLTMGHLDPAVVGHLQAVVLRPLDMAIVNRLPRETGCVLADREHSRVIEPFRLH